MGWTSKEKAREWYQKHKAEHLTRRRLCLAKQHGFTSWEEYQVSKQKTCEQAQVKKQAGQNAKQKKKASIQFYKDKGQRPPWVIVDWTYEQYQQWLSGLGK